MVLWSLVRADYYSVKRWNDEDTAVIYNTITGETHLVEAVALDVVGLLADSPLSVETLARQVASLFIEGSDAKMIEEYIGGTLQRLKHLGLVVDIAL